MGYATGMTIILLYVIINYCMEGTEGDHVKLVSYINKPSSVIVNNVVLLWIIILTNTMKPVFPFIDVASTPHFIMMLLTV